MEDRIEASIRDGAAAGDGDRPCVAPALDPAGLSVPGHSRLELRELVRRIGAGKHPENGLERVSRQGLERRRAANRVEEFVRRPGLANGHGHDLLGQNVERVPGQSGLLDLAFVHPGRDHGGFEEIAAVLGEEDAPARLPDLVTGSSDPLQSAGHARRRLDHDHEVYCAHVDAQLERTRGNDRRQPSGLELFLDLDPLLACERAVMGSHQFLACQLVELVGQPLGQPARVAEDDRGVVLADELQDLRVDCRPDTATCLRPDCRVTGLLAGRPHLAGLGHVLDRHADRQLERLARARVHDLDFPRLPRPARPHAAEESGDRFHRPLRRRKPDPLRRPGGQLLQPLEAEGEVRASLRSRQCVDLVDDDVLDAPQDLGRAAGQDQIERLGRGDQDVRRVADELAPLAGRGVSGPDADLDLRQRLAPIPGRQADAGQRRPQVALDVVDQGL